MGNQFTYNINTSQNGGIQFINYRARTSLMIVSSWATSTFKPVTRPLNNLRNSNPSLQVQMILETHHGNNRGRHAANHNLLPDMHLRVPVLRVTTCLTELAQMSGRYLVNCKVV